MSVRFLQAMQLYQVLLAALGPGRKPAPASIVVCVSKMLAQGHVVLAFEHALLRGFVPCLGSCSLSKNAEGACRALATMVVKEEWDGRDRGTGDGGCR